MPDGDKYVDQSDKMLEQIVKCHRAFAMGTA